MISVISNTSKIYIAVLLNLKLNFWENYFEDKWMIKQT